MDPVTFLALIVDPKRKCTHKKEGSDGQVGHVDLNFPYCFRFMETEQDKQHVDISNNTQDKDDAINNWEEVITKSRLQEGCVTTAVTTVLSSGCLHFYLWETQYYLQYYHLKLRVNHIFQ